MTSSAPIALSGIATAIVVIALLVVIIWAFVFVSILRDRSPSTPVPPNLKPYLEDDALETTRLERTLQFAVILLGVSSILIALVFIFEPTREASAYDDLNRQAVERGETIFASASAVDDSGHPLVGAFGCVDCHGPAGVGGSTEFTVTSADGTQRKVTSSASALNTVLLRFSEDEVRRIVTFGRPGTPMPSWGVAGGGSMTDQQIQDSIAYIESIQISTDEAKAGAADVGRSGAGYNGAALFDQFCARCHTTGASYAEPGVPGDGALGPSLRSGVETIRFPNRDDNVEFLMEGTEFEVAYGNQGIGTGRMPGFGSMLSPQQIGAIVDYIRNSISTDDRTGAIVGDDSGTSKQDVDADVPSVTSIADQEQQNFDEGGD